MPSFTILNTINTPLSNEYDFGIHAKGCADCNRAAARSCTRDEVTLADAAAAEQWVREDLEDGGFEPDEAAAFVVRVFPCAL